MIDKNPKGLFREDLKSAKVISVGNKFGIEAEYIGGEKELLHDSFNSSDEAQKEIDETLKWVGRISLSDSIKATDEVFVKIVDNIKWEANDLALIGILFTLMVGLIPLVNLLVKNLFAACIIAVISTTILMVIIAKIKIVKRPIIIFFRWLLK